MGKEMNEYGSMSYTRYRLQRKVRVEERRIWLTSGAVTKDRLEKDIILELFASIPLDELKRIVSFEVLEPFDDNIEKAWKEGDDFKYRRLLQLQDRGDIEYNLEIKIPV